MITEPLPVDPTPAESAPPAAEPRYVGLATRVLGFVIDAALIDVVAVIVGIGAALIFSVFHLPKDLKALWVSIGAAAYIVWFFAYFVAFWTGTGQTPGARVMQFRVLSASSARLKPARAVVRCAGLILAALPLFLGYLPILFDAERRGLPDYLARTRVVEAQQLSMALVRRAKKRADYEASRGRASTI
jgi:uncharacterized RDD family membrane protein YckC